MDRLPMAELFAGELRRLRVAAGLSQEALAGQIKYSASLVAAVEQCRRPPQRDFTEQCDTALRADGLLLRIREAIMQESLMPWFREWVAIEQDATALRSFEALVVPGLLQTEGYARAVLGEGGRLAGDEVEQGVGARLARQAILDRPNPPLLVAVLDYTVLERPIGGPKVMQEQLLHLVEMAHRPKIHLYVVPRSVGAYAGLSGTFVIATSPGGDEIAWIDHQVKGTIVERPGDVLTLRETWESLRAEAMPHRQSVTTISEAAKTWT
jgi:transcriptional regulator with XRE-family HTH domain